MNNQMRHCIRFSCNYNTYKVIFHYVDTESVGFTLRDLALGLIKLFQAFSGSTNFSVLDNLSGISAKWLH